MSNFRGKILLLSSVIIVLLIAIAFISQPNILTQLRTSTPVEVGTLDGSDDGDTPTGIQDTVSKTFSWTPGANQVGEHFVTFKASDSIGNEATKTVKIIVNDVVTNEAPIVEAGSNQEITLPATALMAATVTDDGLPNPPAALTLAWTKVSGPGTVTFNDSTIEDPTLTFSEAGTYVLQLSASDSEASTSDSVTVVVNPASSSCPGDADGNLVVNIDDITIVTTNFGKTASDQGFDSRADIDDNGVVNIDDLTTVTTNFGKTCN